MMISQRGLLIFYGIPAFVFAIMLFIEKAQAEPKTPGECPVLPAPPPVARLTASRSETEDRPKLTPSLLTCTGSKKSEYGNAEELEILVTATAEKMPQISMMPMGREKDEELGGKEN
jgi:hypothetical protein